MNEMKWCEDCKSNHTEEFGKEFHNRVLFPINLIGDLIAITPEPVQGTIRLPDWKRSLKGTVIARGPDVRDVSEGQVVSFGAAVGMDSVLAGQEIRILKESNIDFVYEITA